MWYIGHIGQTLGLALAQLGPACHGLSRPGLVWSRLQLTLLWIFSVFCCCYVFLLVVFRSTQNWTGRTLKLKAMLKKIEVLCRYVKNLTQLNGERERERERAFCSVQCKLSVHFPCGEEAIRWKRGRDRQRNNKWRYVRNIELSNRNMWRKND